MNVLLKEHIILTTQLSLQLPGTVVTVYLGISGVSLSLSLATLVIALLLEIGSNQKYRAEITSLFDSLGAKFNFCDSL